MPPKRKAAAAASAASKPQKKSKVQLKRSLSSSPPPPDAKRKRLNIELDQTFSAARTGSVYVADDGIIYDAALNQTNIGGNNNKFYFIQLIQNQNDTYYYVHTRWGRVGEPGQSKTIDVASLEQAKKEFGKKFKDKTGLTWEDRLEDSKPKKYTYLQKNYDEQEEPEVKDEEEDTTIESKLPPESQELMRFIFNDDHFNATMKNIGYNKDKLPLGKLSKATLKAGFSYLQELEDLIRDPKIAKKKYDTTHKDALEQVSNKYYTAIPHVTGRTAPPTIDTNDMLAAEVVMLDTLTDMCVAETIKKGKDSPTAEAVALLDRQFNGLGLSEMTPLGKKSKEFEHLSNYLLESVGATHGARYRVDDIFRIERNGEKERFHGSEFAKIKTSNKLLLWHGSRTSNFGGILSQGLRIAPPEAPVSGYAFGKGVYLADCSSKSANYCCHYLSDNTGLLLLIEAELSNPMYEISTGDSNAEARAKEKGYISTKGVGRTIPQNWKDASCVHKSLKGVKMPEGKVGPNPELDQHGYLMYNEYIAYNVSQLRLRYLLKVRMG